MSNMLQWAVACGRPLQGPAFTSQAKINEIKCKERTWNSMKGIEWNWSDCSLVTPVIGAYWWDRSSSWESFGTPSAARLCHSAELTQPLHTLKEPIWTNLQMSGTGNLACCVFTCFHYLHRRDWRIEDLDAIKGGANVLRKTETNQANQKLQVLGGSSSGFRLGIAALGTAYF